MIFIKFNKCNTNPIGNEEVEFKRLFYANLSTAGSFQFRYEVGSIDIPKSDDHYQFSA